MTEGHITLWMPEADPLMIAILGKLTEECSELAGRAARCIIQGIDAIDPETGRTNREELSREMADVAACREWANDILLTPHGFAETMYLRKEAKHNGYRQWQNLILEELKRQGKA